MPSEPGGDQNPALVFGEARVPDQAKIEDIGIEGDRFVVIAHHERNVDQCLHVSGV